VRRAISGDQPPAIADRVMEGCAIHPARVGEALGHVPGLWPTPTIRGREKALAEAGTRRLNITIHGPSGCHQRREDPGGDCCRVGTVQLETPMGLYWRASKQEFSLMVGGAPHQIIEPRAAARDL
jgi:hypothetical protein